MEKYIIENRKTGRLWEIRAHGTETIIGTLSLRAFFTAESEMLRTVSSGTDALTCLKVVFGTQDFYREVRGIVERIPPEDFPQLLGLRSQHDGWGSRGDT